MAWGTEPKQDELARWELRVADLERRIADQKRRVSSELGEGLGAREVLHFMEQTLENWREHGPGVGLQLKRPSLVPESD